MLEEEQSSFKPRYVTIAEVREMYQQKDTPLNADTILATLEPLAGTSFLKHATEILGTLITYRKAQYKPIQALDLFLIFYGAFDDTFKSNNDQQQEDAITCLYLLSGFRVPLDSVYTMKWMQPDELLAREFRSDDLYYDLEKKHVAGTHRAIQFRFYKAGIHRHTVSVSMIAYNDEKRGLKMFTQLSEGNKPHRFISDLDRPPLPFIDPRQTSFLRTSPLLYISPQFSLEKAQPKPSL
jgi:hypothetical protein